MALQTSLNPGQPTLEEQQEQFQPTWDENTTRNLIKQYKTSPSLHQDKIDAIRQHAHYHNVPFYEGEFDILDAINFWLPFVQVRDLEIGMSSATSGDVNNKYLEI